MSRYVSFAVLLAVIAFLTIVFFRILSGFLIPLFLAALLVVIFGPLHVRILDFCKGRKKFAALLTTLSILLVVLLPFGMLMTLAVVEGKDVVTNFSVADIKKKVAQLRTNAGLELPVAEEIRDTEATFVKMRDRWSFDDLEFHQELWGEFSSYTNSIATKCPWLVSEEDATAPVDPNHERQSALWETMIETGKAAYVLADDIKLMPPVEEITDENGETVKVSRSVQLSKYHKLVDETAEMFTTIKNDLAGGRALASLKMLVNPSETELSEYSLSIVDFFRSRILSLGGATTAFVAKLIFGCLIMIIALYFFLLDGPAMIESIQGLSPLDDIHEKELVDEFNVVSRAVVVATLLSAIVQGLLAGIGFYFCGFDSVFLLTMLTTAMALVPFVGAASVWVPACLYLYFIQNDLTSAIGLAIYGVAIISMADNVIKPLVLHGQSNLHPLLALLSVLGGVTALGPIGLLVGPMVVAFLQTLLKILQRELTSMESPAATS
jgi:predicted PurR-regulated permease PerM